MALQLHALFSPNLGDRRDFQHGKPLKVIFQRPDLRKLQGVEVKVTELDVWYEPKDASHPDKGDKQVREKRVGASPETLATFKGDLDDGKFTVTSSDVPELGPGDDLDSTPCIALAFEGDPKVFKVDLTRGQKGEVEGNEWELGLSVSVSSKGKAYSYTTRYPTLIKGAWRSYLDNRGRGDKLADIRQGAKTHVGYCLLLKTHLHVLGFYRREQEPGGGSWKAKPARDSWDKELRRAVRQFHSAALQGWRYDVAADGFAQAPVTFDKADPQVRQEVQQAIVGDKTKQELLRWLGDDYDDAAGRPKWRNPFLFSFANAFDAFRGSDYKSIPCRYDPQSGRILNTLEGGKGFVCTTTVNWFFSHYMLIRDRFDYSANASIVDAVMGHRTQADDGKRVTSTPRYYHELYQAGSIVPAFWLSWMDPLDPELKRKTIEFLGFHQDGNLDKGGMLKQRILNITREVAEIAADRKQILLRYRLPQANVSSLRLFLQPLSDVGKRFELTPWDPPTGQKTWVKRSAWQGGRTVLTLREEVPAGQRVLASYRTRDAACTIPTRNVAYDAPYSCKCSLHKSYQEIIAGKDSLRSWNIVTMCDSQTGFEHSTLTLHKSKRSGTEVVYCLHGDGSGSFRTFEREVKGWHAQGAREMYYNVFAVIDDDELLKLHPTFYWNDSEALLDRLEVRFDYLPPVTG